MTAAPSAGSRPVTRRLLVLLYGIAAAVVVVDQITKQLAVAYLEGSAPIPVVGQLAGLRFLRNEGAAFGMGTGSTWLFTVIALAAFAAVVWFGRRLGSRTWAWALGLLLGGLTGNLIDRMIRPPAPFHGAVVDFIDLYFFVCNVADIAITGAAVVIVVTQLRGIGLDGRRDAERNRAESHEEGTR